MARKSMNIVDLRAWIARTSAWAIGKYISNIYYDKDNNILLVKIRGGNIILAEPGKRIHVTRRRQPPQHFKQDPLVVLARKYMRDKRLEGIGLIGFDRIPYFEASTGYRLVVELVPRGIAALVSPTGTLLAATKYLRVRDREVKPKVAYKPPPSRGKPLEDITADDIMRAVSERGKLVPSLVSLLGVPGEVAEEAVYRAGLDYDLQEVEAKDAEAIAGEIKGILEESLAGRGYIVEKEGSGYIEADPFKPTRYTDTTYSIIEFRELDEALEEYFESSSTGVKTKGTPDSIESEREKLIASLEKARQQAAEYRRQAEMLRAMADFVSRNYHVISRVLDCLATHDQACLEELGVAVKKSNDRYIVIVEDKRLEIPVSVKSVDDLILEYFKRAGVLEGKAKRAESSRVDVEKRLKELDIKAKAKSLYERYKVRRRYWFENFHYTVTRNGFLAVGGRDAGQNELLVRRYLEPHDIFMHADIHGAPAVIIKTRGGSVGEEDLMDAAVIAVAYSKAWKAGLGSVRVFYVNASQVSLSPPTGEYLAKGGVMVYGKKNYLPPIPVRIWLGVTLDEEQAPRLIQGSREVVSRHAIGYASLIPGELKRIEAAREVKKRLHKLLGERGSYILAVPDEDFASRIPGKSRITGVSIGGGVALNFNSIAGP
ncbi:MAG: NFACT family protein [Desulfurococcales archaeon]|nr:NFACT family protein [Desulfurococcales archaeon]